MKRIFLSILISISFITSVYGNNYETFVDQFEAELYASRSETINRLERTSDGVLSVIFSLSGSLCVISGACVKLGAGMFFISGFGALRMWVNPQISKLEEYRKEIYEMTKDRSVKKSILSGIESSVNKAESFLSPKERAIISALELEYEDEDNFSYKKATFKAVMKAVKDLKQQNPNIELGVYDATRTIFETIEEIAQHGTVKKVVTLENSGKNRRLIGTILALAGLVDYSIVYEGRM